MQQRTFASEIKESGEVLPVWHLRAFGPKLVKQGMAHGFDCTQSSTRRIFEQP